MTRLDKQWWLDHGATYQKEFAENQDGPPYKAQEKALLGILQIIQDGPDSFKSVLEIGCGWGRITKLVYDQFPGLAENYFATDLSADAIEQAGRYLGKREIFRGVLDLDNPEGEDTPLVDLVLVSEVLMHRTPQEVVEDIFFLVGKAYKYVISVDWQEPGLVREAEGCYHHDYMSLYAEYGDVNELFVPEAKQSIYVLVRKD